MDGTVKRLFNHAHTFRSERLFCAHCGASVANAVGTPFQCTGSGSIWDFSCWIIAEALRQGSEAPEDQL